MLRTSLPLSVCPKAALAAGCKGRKPVLIRQIFFEDFLNFFQRSIIRFCPMFSRLTPLIPLYLSMNFPLPFVANGTQK
jgi:hypothetical protein